MSHSWNSLYFKNLLKKALLYHCKEQGAKPSEIFPHLEMTRRSFVKGALSTAGWLGISSIFTPALAEIVAGKNERPRIAIVGTGIAGLTAAYYLKKAGLSADIFEAANRTGGRILSRKSQFNDMTVDIGAELVNTDHADILQLVKDFNIKLYDRHKGAKKFPAHDTAFFFDGIKVPEAELAAALAPMAAQIAVDSKNLTDDFEKYAPAIDALSAKEYLDKHVSLLKDKRVRTLLENTIRSEYGCEPHEASGIFLVFNLPVVKDDDLEILGSSDEVYSVVGGTQTITDALTKYLSSQITLDKKLVKIKEQNNQYSLLFEDAAEPAQYDHVIVTIPFPVLQDISLPASVPDKMRKFMKEVGLGRNEKLLAGYNTTFWRKEFFGCGLSSDGPFSQIWDPCQRETAAQSGVLNFYLGGKQVSHLENMPAKEAAQTCMNSLVKLNSEFVSQHNGQAMMTNWTKNKFSKGAYSSFKPGQLTEFGEYLWIQGANMAPEQSVKFGNLYFCGEHLSDAFGGFMNGGAETGRLAAQSIISEVTNVR